MHKGFTKACTHIIMKDYMRSQFSWMLIYQWWLYPAPMRGCRGYLQQTKMYQLLTAVHNSNIKNNTPVSCCTRLYSAIKETTLIQSNTTKDYFNSSSYFTCTLHVLACTVAILRHANTKTLGRKIESKRLLRYSHYFIHLSIQYF